MATKKKKPLVSSFSLRLYKLNKEKNASHFFLCPVYIMALPSTFYFSMLDLWLLGTAVKTVASTIHLLGKGVGKTIDYTMIKPIKYIYKKTHWTKADYAIVEGRFTDAIKFIEKSETKDEETKLKLYKKIYEYATQEAGINNPDDPILVQLYNHGIKRVDPILFLDKKKGPHGGRWTKEFPEWKKKMPATRRNGRKSKRQTRRA